MMYVSRQEGNDLYFYDVASLQVLKGPQGTLFGKNTTAGAVLLTTQRPTDRFEGHAQVRAGSFRRIDTEGALNVPLTDGVYARASFRTQSVRGYLTGPGGFFVSALAGEGSAREAFARLMTATAAAYTDDTGPSGCMISLAVLHDAPERADLREFMREVRGRSRALMIARLDEGVRNGDLPEDADLALIADFFETVFRGMAVRARDGAGRGMLERIGIMALDAWPDGRT